jgi:hypothetical protein
MEPAMSRREAPRCMNIAASRGAAKPCSLPPSPKKPFTVQGSGQVDTRFINVFSGEQSALDGQGCPLDGFTTETVVSLGCGGALFVDFLGPEANAVEFVSGLDVIVGEYGPHCVVPDGGLGADRYTVFLCDPPRLTPRRPAQTAQRSWARPSLAPAASP